MESKYMLQTKAKDTHQDNALGAEWHVKMAVPFPACVDASQLRAPSTIFKAGALLASVCACKPERFVAAFVVCVCLISGQQK